MSVIDCTRSPATDAMRAAGVTGVIRYVSLNRADTVWKRITPAEYSSLRAAGLDVLLNFEYAATDWLGGAAAGAAHAVAAVTEARAVGYPAGCAIPGSADFNMSRSQWDTSGAAYARAYRDGIRAGGYTPGVYGPWDVLGWCQQLGGFGTFWQAGMSTAWSAGRNAQPWPGAHLRQRYRVTIGGVDCDYNDVLQANYGQAGAVQKEEDKMLVLLTVHRPDGTGRTGLADGVGGWHWIHDQASVDKVKAATGLEIQEVDEATALDAYGVVLDPPPASPVDLSALANEVVDAVLARLGRK